MKKAVLCVVMFGVLAVGVFGSGVVAADEGAVLAKAIPVSRELFVNESGPGGLGKCDSVKASLVPVLAVDEATTELRLRTDSADAQSALGFVVPAGSSLEVEVEHAQSGWFEVVMVNRYGNSQAGLYSNQIPRGTPGAAYTNVSGKDDTVYVLVRYPGFMYQNSSELVVKIRRGDS